MIISFIVPCYNVSKYVSRCICSIYEQNLDINDFEVIAVNDGSTDDTLDILTAISRDNLLVLNQENKGLSDARNAGLDKAKGRYVWFIDSDDYLKPNSTNKLLNLAEKNNLDILTFGLNEISSERSVNLIHSEMPHNEILTGADAVISGYRPNSVCCSIYNRLFLEDQKLRFLSKIYHQDVQFNYRAMALASRVQFIDSVPYVYEIRPNSISTTKSKDQIIKRLVDNGIISESFITFSKKINSKVLADKIVSHSRSIALGTISEIYLNKMYRKKDIQNAVIAEFRKRNLYPLVAPTKRMKQIALTCFFNLIFRTR